MLKMSSDRLEDGHYRHRLNGPTMGTRYSAIVVSKEAELPRGLADALFEAVDRVDQQMSTYKPHSDLMRLNGAPVGEPVTIPQDLFTVLETALDINKASFGLFDPAVGDMVDAWGFGAPSNEPDPQVIRQQIGTRRPNTCDMLELDKTTLTACKKGELKLDLSGIAKGYGVDCMARCLMDFDIKQALVGIDGEMRAIGKKQAEAPWTVAVEQPDYEMRQALGVLQLEDAAVATSGDYRHWVKVGDQTFSHTMDPRRGGPLRNKLASVSVLAETCMEADAWATVLLVMGEDAGPHIARTKHMNALFLLREGNEITQIAVGPGFGDFHC